MGLELCKLKGVTTNGRVTQKAVHTTHIAKTKQYAHTIEEIQLMRFKKAVAVIGMGFIAFLICVLVFKPEVQRNFTDMNPVHDVISGVQEGLEIDAALEDAGFLKVAETDTPGWLFEEVIDADIAANAITNNDFTLMNVEMDFPLDQAFERLNVGFESKGWISIDSGIEGMATYIKREGVCNWMMISCNEIQGQTQAVLHIKHA